VIDLSIKNILFRADSSSLIGTGHIMRDLVLAQQFEKEKIFFASLNLSGNINHKIAEAGYALETLSSNGVEEVIALIKRLKIDMIIIDNYEIDLSYEKALREQLPELKIFIVDDLYKKHECDILLNHNLYAQEKKYKDLVPKDCNLRCGSKYTLLRKEFMEVKSKTSKFFTIFVAIGGSDHSGINVKILKTLKKFKNIKVVLVSTDANAKLAALQKYAQNKDWIELQINATNLATLISESNLAIVTPSVTLNEVYFMNTPFIAIKTVDNQNEMYKYLKKEHFLVMKKYSSKKLQQLIKVFTHE